MAANKILNIEPIALSAAIANLLNCGITSLAGVVGFTMTQPYIVIKHVRVLNNDAANHSLKLFKGATGGSAVGTEVIFPPNFVVAANSYADWYGQLRLDSADFLTGLADTASKLTLNIDAEIGVAG